MKAKKEEYCDIYLSHCLKKITKTIADTMADYGRGILQDLPVPRRSRRLRKRKTRTSTCPKKTRALSWVRHKGFLILGHESNTKEQQ